MRASVKVLLAVPAVLIAAALTAYPRSFGCTGLMWYPGANYTFDLPVFVDMADGNPYVWIRNTSSAANHTPEFNATNFTGALGGGGTPILNFYNVPGSLAAPSAPDAGYALAQIFGGSHDGTDYASGASIAFYTEGAWTTTSHGGSISLRTVKPGAVGAPESRLIVRGNGEIQFLGIAFADLPGLGVVNNGSIAYCSDCTETDPCAGEGTGAFAKRLNNRWDCN